MTSLFGEFCYVSRTLENGHPGPLMSPNLLVTSSGNSYVVGGSS